jgi:hypothetical protein
MYIYIHSVKKNSPLEDACTRCQRSCPGLLEAERKEEEEEERERECVGRGAGRGGKGGWRGCVGKRGRVAGRRKHVMEPVRGVLEVYCTKRYVGMYKEVCRYVQRGM